MPYVYYFNEELKSFQTIKSMPKAAVEWLVASGKTFSDIFKGLDSSESPTTAIIMKNADYEALADKTRHFPETITDKNGIEFVVNNQWGISGSSKRILDKFIKNCEKLGLTITKLADDQRSFDSDSSDLNSFSQTKNSLSLNQILYGPPGTGKTFNTVSKALDILGQSALPDWQDKTPQSIEELKQAFPGQVEFVTFHQSFSYEDFVEGIQAKSQDGQISYAVEDGVFKQLCNLASSKVGSSGVESISVAGRKIWKMSLGNTLQDQDFIYEECLENHYVLLGWGDNVDFSACQNRQQVHEKMSAELQQSLDDNNYAVTSVNVFKNVVQKGDLIVVSDGNSKFRAIAEVTGDYEFLQDDSRSGFKQKRMVRWLKTYSPSLPTSRIFDKSLSQMTLYQLKTGTLNLDRLQSLLSEKEDSTHPKRYVLIIDEINRGNISRIFGELITLIEESKRAGNAEAISVQLPYSKEPFSVPNNLYIIGTMNTADRSLALMDTALRRRFDFIEMMPNPDLVSEDVAGVNARRMLEMMNQRIEALYDREHTLGHAFLMSLKTLEDLRSAFRNKILPLLEEYFYDDWQKIRLVLGHAADAFYRKQVVNNSLFVGEDAPSDLVKFERQSIDALSAEAFQKIYQGFVSENALSA